MPSFYKGVRSFIEALRKGVDNIIFNLLGLGTPDNFIEDTVRRKFPDLGPLDTMQAIDFTKRSASFGDRVDALSPRSAVDSASPPLNPSLSGDPVYWVDVEWESQATGTRGVNLVVLRSRPGETKAQFERRAIDYTIDYIEDSLQGGAGEPALPPKVVAVKWLRGYRGT